MRSLYLTLSGAPAPDAPVTDLVALLHEHGWDVTVLSTPAGQRFHDLEALADLTGEPVRVEFRRPGTGRSLPPPDAVVACPWSFTSTNRTALGLAENFAVALVCEMLGRGVPTLIAPKAGAALAAHPAYEPHLAALERLPHVHLMHSADRSLPTWAEIADRADKVTA